MPGDANEILRDVFGFRTFRGLQQQAVEACIAGDDALVLMPTGGGKSLCYQVPALVREGTALVISPLIALMEDQTAALRQLGVAAGALHSELEADEAIRVRCPASRRPSRKSSRKKRSSSTTRIRPEAI